MLEIKRKEDIISEENKISFDSELFKELRDEVSKCINNCISQLEGGLFTGGDITAKISLTLEEVPIKNCAGPITRFYTTLSCDYKAQLVLKKKFEVKGAINPEGEIVYGDDGYFIDEVPDGQIKMNLDEGSLQDE